MPVKAVKRDGAFFKGLVIEEKIGATLYNPRAIIPKYCVVVEEEVLIDGHPEKKTVDLH
jgi:hypothetical protein